MQMSSNSATRVLKAFQWADSQVARAEAKKDQGDAELAERQAEEKKALANSILDKFDENFELLSGLDGQRKSSLDRDKDSRPGAVWNDKFGILNVDGGTVNMSTFGEFRDERGPSGRRETRRTMESFIVDKANNTLIYIEQDGSWKNRSEGARRGYWVPDSDWRLVDSKVLKQATIDLSTSTIVS